MVPGGDEVRQIPTGHVYRGHLGYLTRGPPGQQWLMPVHSAIAQPRLRGGNGAHGHCRSLLARQLADCILLTLSQREIIVARICFAFATKIQERRQLEPRLNRRRRDQLR